ncbi:MAG: transporter [Elusimicrobiota bacterium]
MELGRKLFGCGLVLLLAAPAMGHHGVASLGAAGLEGPGAPVETTVSANLPKGSVLSYLKLDYAQFKKKTAARDAESDYNSFWMYGLGYGIKPYLTGYVFLPYYNKVVEDNSYNTSGFADISLTGVLGFKYDDGFRLVPAGESLDDLEDLHFTSILGMTVPSGHVNEADSSGTPDPGMALGFGTPSFLAGFSASKMRGRHTLNFDTSYIGFYEYKYADDNKVKFGDEYRVNLAYVNRLYVSVPKKLRLDGILEANYLNLGRDRLNGTGELATGGRMLYLQPGVRVYKNNVSTAVGVKLPTATWLNEEGDQQGAEGVENYRLIFSFSVMLGGS